MESRDVFTQAELDETLAQPDLIPICAGAGEFSVAGRHFLRAADSARVHAGDGVTVEAGGAARIVARGRARVRARNRVTVDADDSAVVVANHQVFVRARGQSRVMARASAIVEAAGAAGVTAQARAAVTAADCCHVWALSNAVLNLSGDVRAWVRGTSFTTASERATVSAWGSANVVARGSASVEARENAVVVAGGTTTVRAFGGVMVRAWGSARVEAQEGVAVMRHGAGVAVSRGTVTEAVRFQNAEEWCNYYGVQVEDGVATLYKAVDEEFNSDHGTSYRPGSEPQADDWDRGERECGGGLHFSPQPMFAVPSPGDRMRFLACPVRLEDIVVHPNGIYPDKVKARGVCAPVYEVDEDGAPVAQDVGTG
ncbi:MAG: hypothetical protein ACRDLQ_11115 [Solirubrobacterales bacterium]